VTVNRSRSAESRATLDAINQHHTRENAQRYYDEGRYQLAAEIALSTLNRLSAPPEPPSAEGLTELLVRAEQLLRGNLWPNAARLADAVSDARALLAEREALAADKARLDWWEKQRTNTLAPVMDAEGWRLHEADCLRPLAVPFAGTLREAIDAARAAAEPRETELT
jgi:hypothetical protein